MYYLCEKYYKPITVWYYIADCVSWVPLANFVGFTNKLDFTNVILEWNLFVCRIKDLNIRPDTVKLLEENIGQKLLDISLGNDFFG